MFSKLVVVALFLAVANSAYTGPLAGGQSAAQFPAGIDPQACPNYPICENPSVAVNQVPASAYASPYQTPQYSQYPQAQYSQPQYAQPQYSQAQYPQSQYSQPQYAQPQYVQSRYTSSPTQQYSSGQPTPVQIQQRQYNLAQPQYSPNQAAQTQYPSHLQAALDRGEYIGDGDYHGEGLAESGAQTQGPAVQAYNPAAYQQAYSAQIPQQQYQAAAQPAAYHGPQQPAQLPAGLAPGACPNYPFCQQ